MSQHDSSKQTTTIKIAAKDPSQRQTDGGADPGPGDPAAAPSMAPQLVDIPDPPTSSQLVVKSTSKPDATNASSLKEASKHSSVHNSQLGPAASNPSGRENTSSRPLSGPSAGGSKSQSAGAPIFTSGPNKSGISGPKSGTGGPKSGISGPKSGGVSGPKSAGASGPKSGTGAPMSAGASEAATGAEPSGGSSKPVSAGRPLSAGKPVSAGGAQHEEEEEGEGEVEQPETPTGAASSPGVSGLRGSSQPSTSGAAGVSGKRSSPSGASSTGLASSKPGDKKKKVTRFRYHKRITVHTTGKTSPKTIMDKVNKKDHNAGITPSTIGELDPQELMKRAGIKGTNKTHWRVRLRQTKRLIKDGKTTTQTKVAYRDSQGNKRVRTSLSPNCSKCGKKLEECKCDTDSSGPE